MQFRIEEPSDLSNNSCKLPPNKHMQRAGTHKVLGRGRLSPVLCSTPRARVLRGTRAGADVGR